MKSREVPPDCQTSASWLIWFTSIAGSEACIRMRSLIRGNQTRTTGWLPTCKGHAKQVDAAYAKECALEGMARTQVIWLKEGVIKA